MKTRQDYFNTLTRVSGVVDKTLNDYLDNDEFGEYKKIIYQPVLDKKIGAQKARATISYLSHCALNDIDPSSEISEDVAKLIMVPELEIWSEYMVNWIFDNKGDVTNNPLTRKKAAVASKSFLEDAVKIASEFGSEYVLPVLNTSGNVTNAFTKELDFSFSKEQFLNQSYDDFMNFYLKDYGIPGIGKTYTLGPELLAQYSNKSCLEKTNDLINILDEYGSWLEVLNDLGDFSLTHLTSDKVASDTFADIRNDDIKPPIWLMYKKSDDENKEFMRNCVGKKNLSEFEESKLVKNLFDTGTYETISKNIKKKGRDLKRDLRNSGFNNKAGNQLKLAMTMFESNTIYHRLNQSYDLANQILSESTESTWSDELL